LAIIRDRIVVAAESSMDALKLEPPTRFEMSVVEVCYNRESRFFMWRDLLEALINQARTVSEAEQQIAGEDVIETFLLPRPRLLDVVDLEMTVR
jgi:hypothetical protein